MYDFDRNGTMSFEEFVALNKFLIKVQHAFSDLERGRGFLVLDDVFEVYFKNDFKDVLFIVSLVLLSQTSLWFLLVLPKLYQQNVEFLSLCVMLDATLNNFAEYVSRHW
ncbi:uncharacterized protein LOC107626051 [Arachis ipaensis]|uniref:uncharacterized protein LOC107626051 n=1 Tax=Arachis ipaensis TaxID=130454 RepID=UPI0007AEEA11|nr:uncharacterized protein LOC107626051 [Arachis ipaensis]XP_025634303.1 uncharacterized protein LOC112728402 [Arachis hypogaea]